MIGIGHFLKDEEAGATVEFVAIMGPMMLIVFFIFEVMVEMIFIGTAEKAVQAGARLAVVSNTVAIGLPTTNALGTGTNPFYGQSCSVSGACAALPTTVCTTSGSSCSCTQTPANPSVACSMPNFTNIETRIQNVFAQTRNQYVKITYSDSGLGFAGGPMIPMVKVELQSVPYGGVITGLISNIFNAGHGTNGFASTLPNISVTLTGEDLSS